MASHIEDVAEPPLLLTKAHVKNSYTIIFIVLVVGGKRMGGFLAYLTALLLWTRIMGGTRGELTLPTVAILMEVTWMARW